MKQHRLSATRLARHFARLSVAVLCIASHLLVQPQFAMAQCDTDPEGSLPSKWVRNVSYGADPDDDSDDVFNFSYKDSNGILKPIPMGDPTIMKLQDSAGTTWFFVTGTSGADNAANFPIYRSRDLVSWEFHGYVFDPSFRGTNSWDSDKLFIQTQSGDWRAFMHLWSPCLYVDPNNSSTIYLSFSAAEIWDNDFNDNSIQDSDLNRDSISDPVDPANSGNDLYDLTVPQVTIWVCWIEKSRFLEGGETYWVKKNGIPDRTFMPQWYTYTLNNGTTHKRDGGYAQGQAGPYGYASIPTTGHTGDGNSDLITDPPVDRRATYPAGPPGDAFKLADKGFHWYHVGPRSWPVDSPTVYFDPQNSCDPWLTWTWSQRSLPPNDLYNMNNVAMFPLRKTNHADAGYRKADALYDNPMVPINDPPTQPIQLLFAHTTYNGMTDPQGNFIPNGKIQSDPANQNNPMEMPFGIAEGQDLFYANGRYYLLGSRNPWNHPSYQLVYRMTDQGATSPEELHIDWDWNDPVENVPESILCASDWVERIGGGRDATCRTNYGHAQHFTAYGRHYVIFHHAINTEGFLPKRRVFIKDLYIDPQWGTLGRFYEDGSLFGFQTKDSDVFWFRAPKVPVGSGAPVP